MGLLIGFITFIHIIVCLFLIGVVLLQSGSAGDIAGAFGGAGSQTTFGPRAGATLLTRLTTYAAVIFMVTSISLAVLTQRHGGGGSVLTGTPTAPVQTPASK